MNAGIESEPGAVKNRTTVERKSDREVVVTRIVNGPPRIVFEAFTRADLFQRWWVPRSLGMTLLSCELDARVGGKYRLVFDFDPEPVAFFGTYVEVKPYSRLAWTNEEGGESGPVTTVTFEEKDGRTLVILSERHPSKESLDAAGTGAVDAMGEQFDQLDELLVSLGESSGR
ncbi:MAG TPA: SRPBCC domain-containing protein [Gemmatimonadaceae bacterium]|nr:SRPBCC domain-containing protein [Gemmatimonadaceae bacterium]